MASSLDHLDLPQAGRRRHSPKMPGASPPQKRDRAQFARETLENMRALMGAHRRSEAEFPGYRLDLLFRMRVSRNRAREVTGSLRSVDCEPVVRRFAEDQDWVVRANDRGMDAFQRDIRSCLGKRSPRYVGHIRLISGIDPATKHGPLLHQRPLGELESSRLLVSFWRGQGEDGEARRAMALELLKSVVRKAGFEVTEAFAMRNLCQAMVTSDAALLARIAQIDYVSRVDRPPEYQLALVMDSHGKGSRAGSPGKAPTGRP